MPMILTLDQLATYSTRTNDRNITMSLLANYYETYLFPNYYDFPLSNGVTIRIDFDKENFCHLLGIDQIAEKHFKNPKDTKLFLHKGSRGFRRAKAGNLEFSYLKKIHQHQYAFEEQKFHFFHFLHTMMDSGQLKLVNYVAIPGSQIRCDFMFYDTYDNALLHLGVEKSIKTGNFFPKTFFARYLTDTDADAYIKPQTSVGITECKKVPKT